MPRDGRRINQSTPHPAPGTIGRMFRYAFLPLPSAVADEPKAAVDLLAALAACVPAVTAAAAVAVPAAAAADGARS